MYAKATRRTLISVSEPLDPDMFAGCPHGTTPIRIGDKWTGKIVKCLEAGPRRFSELQVPLWSITPKVLTESLRAMERDGLLTRTAHAEIPPRVEYELTSLGRSLLEPMAACCAWSAAHLPELLDAREAYERSTEAQPRPGSASGRY
jgi:DNA-binding HxlR family transcriptional regulator